MSAETEIERIVVRLVGDSNIPEVMEEASAAVERISNDMDKALADIEKDLKELDKVTEEVIPSMAEKFEEFGGKLQSIGASLSLYVTAPIAAMAAYSIAEFSEMESGIIKLEAAIKSNGGAVQSTLAEYEDFAANIQATTTMSDDAALAVFKTAEAYQLSGDKAKRAVGDAIALAAVNDSNAQSMIRMTAAMAKGDTETAMRFARMIPQLRGIKDETQFVEKYTQLVAAGFAQAEAEATSLTGSLTQLKNEFGEIGEDVGTIIAEVLHPLIAATKDLVKWFQSLSPELKRTLVILAALAAAIGPIIALVGTVIVMIGALTASLAVLGITSVAAGVAMLAALWPVYLIAGVVALAIAGVAYAYSAATEEAKAFGEAAKLAEDHGFPMNGTGGPLPRDNFAGGGDLGGAAFGVSKDFEDLLTKFREQEALLGLTGRQAEIAKLAMEGLGKAEVAQLEAVNQRIEAMEKANKLQAEADSLTSKLQLQAATFGMTTREAEMYKLEMEGATLAQLSVARAADKELTALEKQKKLMEEGKRLTKEFASPEMRFDARQDELKELLEAGAISSDVFTVAMQNAYSELDKLQGTHNIDLKMNGVDAVSAGSAEAIARINEFQGSGREAMSTAARNVAIATAANQPKGAMVAHGGGFFIEKAPEELKDMRIGIERLVELAENKVNTLEIEPAGLVQ